jgi:hypothetical protein
VAWAPEEHSDQDSFNGEVLTFASLRKLSFEGKNRSHAAHLASFIVPKLEALRVEGLWGDTFAIGGNPSLTSLHVDGNSVGCNDCLRFFNYTTSIRELSLFSLDERRPGDLDFSHVHLAGVRTLTLPFINKEYKEDVLRLVANMPSIQKLVLFDKVSASFSMDYILSSSLFPSLEALEISSDIVARRGEPLRIRPSYCPKLVKLLEDRWKKKQPIKSFYFGDNVSVASSVWRKVNKFVEEVDFARPMRVS